MATIKYRTRAGLAEYLSGVLGRSVTVQSLEQWATKRIGPPFVLILNKASYPEDTTEEWLKEIAISPDAWREERRKIRTRNKRRAEQLAAAQAPDPNLGVAARRHGKRADLISSAG